ncbi:zinc finger fyve hypothetical protein [Limosa lapponica baueri]|uniref:Uncharacterized protein n=1 Tax=Limosa lapponica baueri TaxID=1758121 RepID=A0A2I0TRX3_LIMLA|nr:zinc finger fyve hypothetical protein [Limosa lapponica baueri]
MEEAEEDDMTCGDLGNGLGRRPGAVYEGENLQNSYSFRPRKGSGKVCNSLLSAKRGEESDATALPGPKRNSFYDGSSRKPVTGSTRQNSGVMNQQCLEFLAMLDVKQQKVVQENMSLNKSDITDFTSLEVRRVKLQGNKNSLGQKLSGLLSSDGDCRKVEELDNPHEILKLLIDLVIAREEIHGRNATEKVDSKDESNVESMPSDLPKRPELHESHAALPGNCVLTGSSCQTGAEVELEQQISEENVGSEELNSKEILNSVSASCISVEDVQTSLSCLPLPVSICGSLAVTEEKVNPLPQSEMAEVISDIVTVHAGKSKTDLSRRESCENADLHEQEGYITKINESIVEKTTDEEKCDTENVIDDSDSQQMKALASAFLEYEAEPYGVDIDSYYNESMSPVMADFTVEENVFKSDALISDAELDEFLYGQSLQSSVLKSSDNDSNLMEADADEGNLTNVNNMDFTEVTEEHMQAKLEEITSINSNLKVSLTANESESATEENMSRIQDTTESDSEALVSNVYAEGARPKQLHGLSQRGVCQRQLNRTDVLERENQEATSVAPEQPEAGCLSGTSVNIGKNSEPLHSGESSSEAGGNQTSENAETLKIPAALSRKQPLWVPDSEAPNCMNCQVKFTFTKRRHHCRACGKAFERMMSPTGPVPNPSISSEYSSAVPPLEEAQISGSASSPSPSALLPISVLKQPGIEGLCPKEQRRVWFADGILPNGEVADTTKLSSGAKRSSQESSPVNPDLPEMHMAANPEENNTLIDVNPKPKEEIDTITRMEELCPSACSDDAQQAVPGQSEMVHSYTSVALETKERLPAAEAEKTSSSSVDQTTSDMPVSPSSYRALCGVENCVRKEISLVPDGDKLPPLLLAVGEKGKDPLVEEHPSRQQITLLLVEGGPNPLTFILNTNLLVNVKLITYSSEKCWYFSTNGLHGLGQAEIVILLQCLPDEEIFPSEIFKLFMDIYKDAMKGRLIRNMENITFTENFLGNKEHGGFLFVSPIFQKLDDQILPDSPFLCGILIHKMEIPWAKVFPIRLMLRLGAEYGDGLMVQITPETMESLRQALRDKKDFKITCGKTDTGDVKEYVDICWVANEEKTNKRILSPVDGKSMEGTQSEKVLQGRDFERDGKVMKCTEVYYFLKEHELSSPVPQQFAKEIAAACSTALCRHLKTLKNNGMNKIGLRVSVDSDMVEYLAGSGGHLLPQGYLNELDSALIPVIHGDVHMIEADVLLRGGLGGNGDPIMAHPPETDSDITLQEWLKEIVSTNKGIKLDFKSLEAVRPSLELLDDVKQHLRRPVWINADILPGPNGKSAVVDAEGFLDTVTSFFPDVTLSLGWTTGWHPDKHNEAHLHMLRNFEGQIAYTLFEVVHSLNPMRIGLVQPHCLDRKGRCVCRRRFALYQRKLR